MPHKGNYSWANDKTALLNGEDIFAYNQEGGRGAGMPQPLPRHPTRRRAWGGLHRLVSDPPAAAGYLPGLVPSSCHSSSCSMRRYGTRLGDLAGSSPGREENGDAAFCVWRGGLGHHEGEEAADPPPPTRVGRTRTACRLATWEGKTACGSVRMPIPSLEGGSPLPGWGGGSIHCRRERGPT